MQRITQNPCLLYSTHKTSLQHINKQPTMEALGLPSLSTYNIYPSNSHDPNCRLFQGTSHTLNYSDPIALKPRTRSNTRNWRIVRAQVVEQDYELKQMKDMAAARKRWEAMVREGKVKALTPREAGYAIQLSGKTLLDVRPESEHKKAWVKGSTWIPIFDIDGQFDFGAASRKATNFVMGGWWSGAPTLLYNRQFLREVERKFPKDTDLIIACQKGLRSLAACELLHKAGYENLFWVQGGLENAEEEDLRREGPQPFKFAGIGGISAFLGWTDQQRAAAAKEGWQYRLVFSARLVGLFIVADGLFIAAQQAARYLQDINSH